jgi:hypothetical protein
MALAVRILGDHGEVCTVPVAEVELVIEELRRLPAETFPSAGHAAVILQSTLDQTIALPEVRFERGENNAINRAIDEVRIRQDGNVTVELRCWQDISAAGR